MCDHRMLYWDFTQKREAEVMLMQTYSYILPSPSLWRVLRVTNDTVVSAILASSGTVINWLISWKRL